MSRLLEVADLCSRTVSDPANRLRKTRKKILCRSPFSKRSHIGNLRQIRKQGKGRSSKRKENRRLSFLFAPAVGTASSPPRGAARSRRPQTANSPLKLSGKLSARIGRTRLRQFAHPAGSVQKRSRPSGANTLTQFEHPAGSVQKRSRPSGANTLTQFEHPAGSVQKRSRPDRANPPAAVRVPRSAGAEKKPPGGQGRKRCRFITIKN